MPDVKSNFMIYLLYSLLRFFFFCGAPAETLLRDPEILVSFDRLISFLRDSFFSALASACDEAAFSASSLNCFKVC